MKKGEEVTIIPERQSLWLVVTPSFDGPNVAGIFFSRKAARLQLKATLDGRLVKVQSVKGEVQ